MGSVEDITRLQQELAILDELHSFLCGELPVAIWTTDVDLRFTSHAGSASNVLPISTSQSIGMTLFDYFGTTDPNFPPISAALRALAGQTVRFNTHWSGRAYLVSVAPLLSPAGAIIGTLGVALDCTPQRDAESALGTVERRLRDVLEHVNDVVYTHDLNGRMLTLNRTGERLLGYTRDQIVQLNIEDITASHQRGMVLHMMHLRLRDQGSPTFELELMANGGNRVTLDVSTSVLLDASGNPTAIQGIGRDVSERRRQEKQLRHFQRLEAIGILAGIAAHEFNNLLTGILGNAYVLKSRLRDSGRSAEALHGILEAAERAIHQTHHLVGLARRSRAANEPVDIHAAIRAVAALLDRAVDKRVRIVTELDAPHPAILGDGNQIHQALLTLGLNARDAMPEGGEMRFSTHVDGSEVVITVRDTGCGIPEAIRGRIFDPFFTTKMPEEGRGLGLAMVQGIVRNHGGTIDVDSSERGSAFHISLPLPCGTPLACERAAEGVHAPAPTGRRALVVDDEEVVRRVLSRMLEELGYETISASNGEEAVALFAEERAGIDLVTLDMVMPDVGGKECLRRLREIDPRIRVVLSTGYGHEKEAREVLDQGGAVLLEKPYSLTALAEAIRRSQAEPLTSSEP